MNKFLLIAAFLFCFGTVSAKAEDLNMSIAAPQCFGTDFTNLTDSMNNIIKCMNINAVNSEEGIEQINQRQDILNEFGANLYSLATAVRVKLDMVKLLEHRANSKK